MAWRGENLDILSLLWMGDGGYEMKEVTNFKLHMDFVDCLSIRAALNWNIDYCNIVIIQYKYSILSLCVLLACEKYHGIIPTVAFPCRLRERKCVMFVIPRGSTVVFTISTWDGMCCWNVIEALLNYSSSDDWRNVWLLSSLVLVQVWLCHTYPPLTATNTSLLSLSQQQQHYCIAFVSVQPNRLCPPQLINKKTHYLFTPNELRLVVCVAVCWWWWPRSRIPVSRSDWGQLLHIKMASRASWECNYRAALN